MRPKLDTIGKRLRAARLGIGFSPYNLMLAAELRHWDVPRLEKDANVPGGKILTKLARELGVSADWLLGLTPPTGHLLREARIDAGLTLERTAELVNEARKARKRGGTDTAEQIRLWEIGVPVRATPAEAARVFSVTETQE